MKGDVMNMLRRPEDQIQIITGAITIGFLDSKCDYKLILQPIFS